MKNARFADLLRLLAENEVEFVVVGMAAGILQGAPITTIDLDIVHRRSPENVARLLRVLTILEAVYRHDPPVEEAIEERWPADYRLQPTAGDEKHGAAAAESGR